MWNFILALFSVIALLGLVAPSSTREIYRNIPGTNANQLPRSPLQNTPARHSGHSRQGNSFIGRHIAIFDHENGTYIGSVGGPSKGLGGTQAVLSPPQNTTVTLRLLPDNSSEPLIYGSLFVGANLTDLTKPAPLQLFDSSDCVSVTALSWNVRLDNGAQILVPSWFTENGEGSPSFELFFIVDKVSKDISLTRDPTAAVVPYLVV